MVPVRGSEASDHQATWHCLASSIGSEAPEHQARHSESGLSGRPECGVRLGLSGAHGQVREACGVPLRAAAPGWQAVKRGRKLR